MATLFIFTSMLIAGAAVGMFALQRANEALGRIHDITDKSRDINDIYKDTARTRSALMRVYADLKEIGRDPGSNDNLELAQKYQLRSQKALQAFVQDPHAWGVDARLAKDQVRAAEKLIASLDKAIAALRSGDIISYTHINSGEVTLNGTAFSKLLERFQQECTELSSQLMTERENENATVRTMVGVGIFLALGLIVVIHVFLRKSVLAPLENAARLLEKVADGNLTEQAPRGSGTEIGRLMGSISHMQEGLTKTVSAVRRGTDSISQAAQEIANGNADLSMRTEAQASSLEETAAAMEELTSTVQQTAESTQQARDLVHVASDRARESGLKVGQMATTMANIDESSRKVADIIAVIEGISFQTNILALNAAVEAARAGEHGRGFAVVASEVRTLAQRSAVAASEIRTLIEDSVEKVSRGSQLATGVEETIDDMVHSVQKVEKIVIDIAEASREQSIGIAQVGQAIAQMDDVTQSNAALVEQAAAATQAMNEQTKALIKAVSVFKLGNDEVRLDTGQAKGHLHKADGHLPALPHVMHD